MKLSLKKLYSSMCERQENNGVKYYFITIVADEEGNPSWSTQTHWSGFADEECKIELREASLMCADRFIKLFRDELKEECLVVDTPEELMVFMLLGGHAVVESKIAEAILSEFLKPAPAVRTGFTGFQHGRMR